MNWLDAILLLPLVFGLVRGLMHGLISEVITFAVVILGALGARFGAPSCSVWLLHQFAWPQSVCDVVAYTLVFLAIAVVLSVTARLLTKFMRAIHLGWANRLLGGAFGVLKYGIIVLAAVFIMDRGNKAFHWLEESPVVKTSVMYPQMVKLCDIIYQSVPISEKEKAPSAKQ